MNGRAPALGAAERELLLRCARVDSGDPGALARLLERPLDWEALVFHARLHSVAPLVHRHLSAGPGGRVPRGAARALLALRHRAAYQNALFADEHRSIVAALDAARVPVLVQKGLAVVEPLYGRLDLRPLVDLIYLVPPGRRDAAAAVIAGLGYELQAPHPVDGLYRWCCPQVVLERAGRLEVSVIVQDDLVSWPRVHALRPRELWERAGEARLAGCQVRLLDPTDMLLYLCLQADNHGHFNRVALDELDASELDELDASELLFAEWSNNRLVRFTDVYEAARRLPWDAAELARRARSAGLGDAARTTLALTNRLLGPVAAPELLDELDAPRGRRVRRLAFRSLAASERPGRGGLAGAAGRAWRLARPRTQIRLARLVGLAEYAAPSPRQLRLRYGPASRAALAPLAAVHPLLVVGRSALAFGGLRLRRRPGSGLRSRVRF